MVLPFVSLVVVNYNGASILGQCLASLARANYPKDRYEIIVVDNASTDNSLDIVKKFSGVNLIQNPSNMGYVGVNSCMDTVKGKYVFVLNNDMEMEKNCLKAMVSVFEKDDAIGVVAPKFVNYFSRDIESSGTWVSRSFYTGHYIDKEEVQAVKDIPYLGIEMVRTDLVKRFGYIYDPDYFIYAEDLDLSLRFKLMGYKTMYVPSAMVFHMHAATTKKSSSIFTTFLMERNLMTTFFKILSVKNILLFSPYVFGMRIISMLKDLVTLNFKGVYAKIKAVLWVISHIPMIYRKRKETQSFRKVSDKDVLSIFSEKHLFKKKALL